MQLQDIFARALEGKAPARDEMVQLLQYSEFSLEAGQLRAVANHITRKRTDNHAILSGQIGYSTSPCSGDCSFCVFGAGHSTFPSVEMSVEEVVAHAKAMTQSGMISLLWLMGMHDFDLSRFLELLTAVKASVPDYVVLASNLGDLSLEQTKELKAAGLGSAYHTVRLREGIDTKIDRETRLKTIRNIQEAGLGWGFCCEPIGPEHTPEELADQILFGLSLSPKAFGAMRRVYLPNSPIADRGQISFLRHAQIVAVVSLAALVDPEIISIGGHEPNLIALTSGSNGGCAESGANPRDEAVETSGKRGLTVDDLACLFYEAGFEGIIRSDKSRISLKDYFKTKS